MPTTTENSHQPSQHLLDFDGRQRHYLLYRPPQTAAASDGVGCPVVLAFHGAGTTAESMAEFCGLHELGATAGFAVVYPSGTGRRKELLAWNAGNCCGYAHFHAVDDVGFITALLDDLPNHIAIDFSRVYAAGMSNGGMLAYRLAAERADRFAAIAAVGGSMAIENPQPSRPTPVIHIHGDADEFAPYHGGVGDKSMYRTPKGAVEATVRIWAEINGCGEPTVQIGKDHAGDGTHVETYHYRARNRTGNQPLGEGQPTAGKVILHKIVGGGHTWPGRPAKLQYLGPTTANLDANAAIWEFFQRYKLPGEVRG